MFLSFGVERDSETNEFRGEWSHFLDKVSIFHGRDSVVGKNREWNCEIQTKNRNAKEKR